MSRHAPGRNYQIDRDDTGLTAQERRALQLAGDGLTAAGIGRELGVSRQRAHTLLATARTKAHRPPAAAPKPSDPTDRMDA